MERNGPLELWGGIECTVARIGDDYRDQFAETGHHDRLGDLDLVAGLGIRTLRYPVLWEAVSGEIPNRGWAWHDVRMERLRELGMRPIVGLIHHGSGPRGTDLLDTRFPGGLADHARRVAERYPWVSRFTPVNEPLTTGRFSALYGHWYPHRTSLPDFLQAVVNQCRAVVLSMDAIREVNPTAELVQTEDIGRIFATPVMSDQARHENGRRWLSLDLLFGRIGRDHPWWDILLSNGIGQGELEFFWPARPPDIIGVNHYLTSDRYLDERHERYPDHLRGSNGRWSYADAEAVRMPHLDGRTGPAARLREVAERYEAPIAVTEAHHGCTRDEQLRWFGEVWDAAVTLRREGADIRAVTMWSLFGAVDWNSLLTRRSDFYEAGAFDVQDGIPRPTALAAAATSLARGEEMDHPVLGGPGWWRRPLRVYASGPDMSVPRNADAAPEIALVSEPGPFQDECRRIADLRGIRIDPIKPGRRWAPDPPASIWAVLDASAIDAKPTEDDASIRSRLSFSAQRRLPYAFLSRLGAGLSRQSSLNLVRELYPQAAVVTAGTAFDAGIDDTGQDVSRLIHSTLDFLVDGGSGLGGARPA